MTLEDGRHDPEMRSHWWWRPGWRIGRRAYTFHITFDDDDCVQGADDLRRVVGVYQDSLSDIAALDQIPPRWLHLTMQGVGFTDEVTEGDVQRILAAATHRCRAMRPFRVEFRDALVTAEGVLLPATPSEPVSDLRNTIRSAIADVSGDDRVAEASAFHPHVTLAYSNAAGSSSPVIRLVENQSIPPATLTVRAASLIILNRDDEMYKWDTYATVPLGPAA